MFSECPVDIIAGANVTAEPRAPLHGVLKTGRQVIEYDGRVSAH